MHPVSGKKETAESLILSVSSSRTRAVYKRTFTVLYVNKSSLKSAQRAPKPIVVKTKRKTKEERFLLFYGAPLGNFCEDRQTPKRREKTQNLRVRLVNRNVSFD